MLTHSKGYPTVQCFEVQSNQVHIAKEPGAYALRHPQITVMEGIQLQKTLDLTGRNSAN